MRPHLHNQSANSEDDSKVELCLAEKKQSRKNVLKNILSSKEETKKKNSSDLFYHYNQRQNLKKTCCFKLL